MAADLIARLDVMHRYVSPRGLEELCAEAKAALEAKDAEIARLRLALTAMNDEISQTLGKALDYPWFKDDPVNFPGATEEAGVCVGDEVAESLAIGAAREIAALKARLAAAPGDAQIEAAAERIWGEWCLWAPSITKSRPVWADLDEGNRDIARHLARAAFRAAQGEGKE